MASKSRVLYVGVTNDIESRVFEHNKKVNHGFTAAYNVNRLVYFEEFASILVAIQREKQLKNWHRQWKINLIENENPEWKDLSEDWDDRT